METYYIRFGGVPKDEKSYKWNTDGNVQGEEPGVSVYDALYMDDGWHLVLPQPVTSQMMNTVFSLLNYQKRQVFVVTGEYVGRGSDNEPCIRNVRIVENITHQFVLSEKI